MMTDPTYERQRIAANPTWELAFTISEIRNDNAPIGWAVYIPLAEILLEKYKMQLAGVHATQEVVDEAFRITKAFVT